MHNYKNSIVFSNILVYSITHALVDTACVALVFGIYSLNTIDTQQFIYLIILYNLLAFALQSPLGLMADMLKIPVHSAVAGVLLVALSTLFVPWPFFAVALAGIGNALFHVGGGIISLNLEPQKAKLPGIFVAPGALGVVTGVLIGKSGLFMAGPFIALLLASATLMLWLKTPEINYTSETTKNNGWFGIIVLLLLVSIAVRGLIGLGLVLPWKSNLPLLISLTLAVVAGKALGGLLGDRLGWLKTAMTGLTLAALLLSFFSGYPWLAIMGAFFFNLSMPITLTALSNLLPGKAGFAFGLTTLALIVGALPAFTQLKPLLNNQITVLSTIVFSIIVLYLGLKLYFASYSTNRTSVNDLF